MRLKGFKYVQQRLSELQLERLGVPVVVKEEGSSGMFSKGSREPTIKRCPFENPKKDAKRFHKLCVKHARGERIEDVGAVFLLCVPGKPNAYFMLTFHKLAEELDLTEGEDSEETLDLLEIMRKLNGSKRTRRCKVSKRKRAKN